MKDGQFSKRKAVIVASSICLVFGIASWLARTSPYDFEVVTVVQNPGENMKVKMRFTNGSDEPMDLWSTNRALQSIFYIPATQTIPKHRLPRSFAISGNLHSNIKTVQPHGSLVIEDHEGIRKSGEELIAIWQPPASSDWLSSMRRKLDYKLFGFYPIDVLVTAPPPPPKTVEGKLRSWISPDPPRLLVSKKFVVP